MWVSVSSGGPVYLGTTEDGLNVSPKPFYVPVKNDLAGGQRGPDFDVCYLGEASEISGTLTRWNMNVALAMQCRWNPNIASATPGADNATARGTLLATEGAAYNLYIIYPYASLPAFATLPAGMRFLQVYTKSPERLEPGVKPYKMSFTWETIPYFAVTNGSFNNYDFNVAGVPLIAPN